jgi:hypothetical protein
MVGWIIYCFHCSKFHFLSTYLEKIHPFYILVLYDQTVKGANDSIVFC